jgi:hypothetical protein
MEASRHGFAVRRCGSPASNRADRIGALDVRKHQDVVEFGASRCLRGELDYQNQVRDHAADENDRPDKLLQQRLISVSAIRWGFEWPVLPGVHRAAQSKPGTMYQARKARIARTMITIAVYLTAAYPARPDDSGSGLWV